MNDKENIALTASELKLVCNKEWILTKHSIIQKVYEIFGALALYMQQYIGQYAHLFPKEVTASNPKISKGENYQLLPYVMLDYPRHFTKESTAAIRTLFWWGNFFSINLHLSGTSKDLAAPALNKHFTFLQQNGYWLCINRDPWQHHFEKDNYAKLEKYTALEFASILQREPFIKIAKRIPLQQWGIAAIFLENHFNEMITLLQINSQGDERDLLPGTPTTGSGL